MAIQNSSFMRWTSRVMIVFMASMAMPLTASAGMVQTDVIVDHAMADQGRAKIMALVSRDDVRAQLEMRGVTTEQAQARVDALTDDEAMQIAGKLDQLPAGGDILGTAVFIFIVLLVTDILGFTKVFPFTRSMR
ncbi:MAG: PA2779 family protein [Gammaproteobacteria bacterium]|nr:PA2779 family protein [Gammaproteobacteria bacterium]MBU1624377.1 PA2779 family protein [Gammaproteobacteria bacterium]MBU1981105.1 PA2779 family protein [Gammaproteobacteria bacterium]